MRILDTGDSEGYYWLCRVARREVGARESLGVSVGGVPGTMCDLCERDPPRVKRGARPPDEIGAWLEPYRAREGFDEQELPVAAVLATYVLEGRDDDSPSPLQAEARRKMKFMRQRKRRTMNQGP